jgi:hypothetical protein
MVLVLAFTLGPFIEPDPGSNWPGWICWRGWSALAIRFLIFCAAFAFARCRALALVMSASPFLFLGQPRLKDWRAQARLKAVRTARLDAPPHSNQIE